jgi:inosose dehydratase
MIAVAGAPVSFGAFEVTVGVDPRVPAGEAVLDAVQQAGYEGIDLGPPDYLGGPAQLRDRLQRRGLTLSGGYVAMPFSDPAGMAPALDQLRTLLDLLEVGRTRDQLPAPKPTLADAGSGARRAAPGRATSDRGLGLQPEAWDRLAAGVQQAAAICRERGYEPTFHHHAGSFVEAPWEIEELLSRTDIGLCLDTGHLTLGGGDSVKAIADWGTRINHLHLKDVRRAVIDRVFTAGGDLMDLWREGSFCVFGDGDLDIDAVLEGLRKRNFSGWLVVEQDMLPRADDPFNRAARDQQRNREYLRARGL